MATQHAALLGIGLNDLRQKGYIWAVVRQKVEVLQNPAIHQRVQVRTWPHTLNRMGLKRDYEMTAEDGTVIAKGTSEWVVLDAENKQFVNAADVYTGPTDFCEDRMFEGRLRKVKDFESEKPRLVLVPQFTDMDSNMHVNNARYFNFIANALENTPDKQIRWFQIDYRKELMVGQPASLNVMEDELGTHVNGLDPEGNVIFNCLLGY